jgi:hypothetical protein
MNEDDEGGYVVEARTNDFYDASNEEKWTDVREGTRDFCLGWAIAMDSVTPEVGAYRVVSPDGQVIWPFSDDDS